MATQPKRAPRDAKRAAPEPPRRRMLSLTDDELGALASVSDIWISSGQSGPWAVLRNLAITIFEPGPDEAGAVFQEHLVQADARADRAKSPRERALAAALIYYALGLPAKQVPQSLYSIISGRGSSSIASLASEAEKADFASRMTDPVTRDQVADMMEARDAKIELRFEQLLGEFRLSNATLAGEMKAIHARLGILPSKWTMAGAVFGGMLAALAVIVAMLAYAGDAFERGATAGEIARSAADQAVTAARDPVPQAGR